MFDGGVATREGKSVGEGRRVLQWKERARCNRRVLVGQPGIALMGHLESSYTLSNQYWCHYLVRNFPLLERRVILSFFLVFD